MAPLLADPKRAWKAAAFSQYPRGRIMGYTMRTDRHRYTEWQDRRTRRATAVELYDHRTDPGENVNIAKRPQNQALLARLSRTLRAGWRGALPPS